MSIKGKILSVISFMCLAVALFMVGVWAVTETEFKVSGNIEYIVPAPDESEYPYLTFSYSDETSGASLMSTRSTTPLTASVVDCSTDASVVTEAVVPEKIKHNDKIYIVTTIEGGSSSTGAFAGCTNLTSIELPQTVTTINTHAFYNCTGLTSMNYLGTLKTWVSISFGGLYSSPAYYTKSLVINGEIITSISAEDLEGVTSIGGSAFWYYAGLTNVEIPSSVTSIRSHAFHGCSGLTSIEIPNSVTSIESYAFHSCSGLTSIEIPNSVTSIGDYAFQGCSGLKNMNYLGTLKDWVSISFGNYYSNPTYCTKSLVIDGEVITTITAEDLEGVTSIGQYAFYNCTNLTNIEIPSSVTSIGDDAFYYCTSLTSIVVDENNEVYDSRDNCNAIIETSSNSLVLGCKNTIIPNSVISVGDSAFHYCTSLTSIEIPDSVKTIELWAFRGCTSLATVTIGNGVTSIRKYAFYDCKGLTSIEIPNSVTSIGVDAFYGCKGLTSVTIGSGVTSIGSYAFSGCSKLTTITIDSETVASGLTGKSSSVMGYILYKATTIYIKEGLTVTSYISTNYTLGASDKSGYVMYTA